MKTLFFDNKDEKKQVIESIKNYFDYAGWDYPDWVEKVENGEHYSAFNIEAVIYDEETVEDSPMVVDYRIFDPYKKVFDGYVGGNGWSNWCLESFSTLPNELKEEVEELGYDI